MVPSVVVGHDDDDHVRRRAPTAAAHCRRRRLKPTQQSICADPVYLNDHCRRQALEQTYQNNIFYRPHKPSRMISSPSSYRHHHNNNRRNVCVCKGFFTLAASFIVLYCLLVAQQQQQQHSVAGQTTTPLLQARRVPIAELNSFASDNVAVRQQRAIANSVTPSTFPDADDNKRQQEHRSHIDSTTPKPPPSPYGRASELDIKCTTGQSMQLVIKTRLPFDGLIFIGKTGSRSPQCRLEGRDLNRHELTIPLRQCGVVLNEKTETYATYAVHVYVQYHFAIQQAKDDQLYSECRVPIFSAVQNNNKKASLADERAQQQQQKLMMMAPGNYPQLIGQEEPLPDVPVENAWMEILRDSNDGEQQQSAEFAVKQGQLLRNDVSLGERLIVTIKTPKPEFDRDGNIVSDADVVMCRVHDNSEHNFEMLIDRQGCPLDSSIMPAFKIYQPSHKQQQLNSHHKSSELIRYSIIQAFKFPDNNHLHFSCKVIYCAGPCPRVNCTSVDAARQRNERLQNEPQNAYYRAIEDNERRAAAAAHAAAFHAFIPIPQDDVMGGGRAITLTPGSIANPTEQQNDGPSAAYYNLGSGRYKRDTEGDDRITMRRHLQHTHIAVGVGASREHFAATLERHKRQARNNYYYEDLPFYSGGSNVVGERDVVNSVRVYNNPNDTSQAAAFRQGRENVVDDNDLYNNQTIYNNQTTVARREEIPHGRLFCLRSDLFWAILGLLLGFLVLLLLIALLCCCKRHRRRQLRQKHLQEQQQQLRNQASPYYYYSDSGMPSTGYQPYTATKVVTTTTTVPPPPEASSIYQYPPYMSDGGGGIPPARLRR